MTVSDILHLNLHREFFAEIVAGPKRIELEVEHLTGANALKVGNTKSSNSAMVIVPMPLRC
jgi:hypothetical protein